MASGTSEETAPTGDDGTPASEAVMEKDKEEAEVEAEPEAEAETEAGTEAVEEVKEKKKRGRKRGQGKKEEGMKTPEKVRKRRSWVEKVTPVERPSRERKTVERYMSMSPRKPTSPKGVPIKKGSGMKLRDIPNVFFKLSKRKVDENLQHLHRILFGKKATAHYLKRNIFEFSGFVWSDSEEKDKAKLREKLDKCVKDRLLDFCDILDISVSRTGTKKEDVIVLMLDFLQCPRVTRDVVLKDKEQSGKKRKRKAKGGNISTSRQKKRKKKISGKTNDDSKEEKERDTAEDDSAVERDSKSDEDISEHGDQDKNDADEEDPEIGTEPVKDSPAEKKIETKSRSFDSDKKKSLKRRKSESNKDTSKKKGGSRTTASETSSPAKSVSAKDNKESVAPSGSKFKNATGKKQKNQDSSTRKKASEKQTPEIKAKPRASSKDDVGRKGKAVKKDVESPTRDEMHAVVSGILKEVDFDTATLADILRQLGIHFGADLMHRKAEVKSIIEEVINSMTDESDEEGGGAGDASRKGGDAETSVENDDSKGRPVRSDDDVKESPQEGKDE